MHAERGLADALLVQDVRHRHNHVQQQIPGQTLHLGQPHHLRVIIDDHPQRVVLYVGHLHAVRCLQDLQDIVVADVVLQVVLAVRLQSIVGQCVEAGRLEEVQGVLGWHLDISVVNVTQE